MIKSIGIYTALALIIANTVGAGILTTTGYLARDIGNVSSIMSLWVVGGFLALCGAYCYAALAREWPSSGGEYVYLRASFGPKMAFLSGWTSLTLGFGAAIAASALGLAEYFYAWLPWDLTSPELFKKLLALTSLVIVSVLHCHSLDRSRQTQLLLTGGKLLLLVGIFAWAASALPAVDPQDHVHTDVSLTQLGTGLVYVMYAYSGWNAICYISGEVKGGATTVVSALILGCLLITVIYVAINDFYFSALSIAALAEEPILPVAKKALSATLGEDVGRWFSLAVVLSITSAMSAMTWLGPKVYQQMASDGLAPNIVQATNAANVPQVAVVLQSGWAAMLIISGTFDELLLLSGGPLLLFSALAVSCVWRMKQRPQLSVSVAAILFIGISLTSLTLLTIAKPVEVILGITIVSVGLPVFYYLNSRVSLAARRSD